MSDPDSSSGLLAVETTVEEPRWAARFPDLEARAAAWCRAAASGAGHDGPAELSLVFADDARVRVLNRDWRGQDKPTNVLSFPLSDEPPVPGAPALLGDVVLAFETVLREAEEQGKAADDHLAHLIVHGTLHLLGHDHVVAEAAAAMEALETRILRRLDIADPYADTSAAGTDPTHSKGHERHLL